MMNFEDDYTHPPKPWFRPRAIPYVLQSECDALQARIDALMLEYCPDEMTAEQMANWASHQRTAPIKITDGMAYDFHRAIGDGDLGRDDIDEIKKGLTVAFANITVPAPLVEKPDIYVHNDGLAVWGAESNPHLANDPNFKGYRECIDSPAIKAYNPDTDPTVGAWPIGLDRGRMGTTSPPQVTPKRGKTLLPYHEEVASLLTAVADLRKATPENGYAEAVQEIRDFILSRPYVVSPHPAVSEHPDFIRRTNEDYAAWCKSFYRPEALDERGFRSLDGLWAWQERERRFLAATKESKT